MHARTILSAMGPVALFATAYRALAAMLLL